jgi:hypothetical protein
VKLPFLRKKEQKEHEDPQTLRDDYIVFAKPRMSRWGHNIEFLGVGVMAMWSQQTPRKGDVVMWDDPQRSYYLIAKVEPQGNPDDMFILRVIPMPKPTKSSTFGRTGTIADDLIL